MRSFFAAIAVIALGGSFVGAGGLNSRPTAGPMGLDSSMGFILRAHRTAFGLTQDSLSKLTTRTVTASKISRLERGLDSGTVAQADSLVLALWRVSRARLHPDAERRFNLIVRRNLVRMTP